MERKSNLPNKILTSLQHSLLVIGKKIIALKLIERHSVVAAGHPADHLNISQSTGTIFNIGFKAINSIRKFGMSLLSFFEFGAKKSFAVPNPVLPKQNG